MKAKSPQRWTPVILLASFAVWACSQNFGKVDQGRVIAYDKEKKTVTFIRDVSKNPGKPDYSHLPPVTYTLPADPAETGPEPRPGLRFAFAAPKGEIVLFDPAIQAFKKIQCRIIENYREVEKDSPLLYDNSAGRVKSFPVVDRGRKTVTIYSGAEKTLTTIAMPEDCAVLPDNAWEPGDEVRVYYKEEGKALRFMNISRADLFKK